MENKYSYPSQIGAVKRKDKTFAVDAKLFPEDGNVAGPLIMHAGYSRFSCSIIDKKQNTVVTANIPFADIKYIKKMTDDSFTNTNTSLIPPPSSAPTADKQQNKAFSVKLKGHFEGKSPGEILLETPSEMEKLLSTKKWLEDNLAKFAGNGPMIEAINDAVAKYNSGTLIAPSGETPSPTPTSSSSKIYSSEWKFLKSKPKGNNLYFVYSLDIDYTPGNKYPYEVKISNGYAPLSEMDSGQTTIQLSRMEDKTVSSILLTKKEWYVMITNASDILFMFDNMIFKQQYDKMTEIVNKYHSNNN